ncbi:UDP-N-acetylmuramoyl-L-alanine--D-glutamate ligase [Prochlorococcus sp. MIT 1307]|uniref:UDP-N-acetylmuramoyl-L-alanine--D-glutamate ligase n=1 Tax=Prochlorococcus sp. MIT 1307 TaxID=3096219 RepID=UPI002A75C925|nr:UDP-N-acetylmuramoyl-L-alanine--D-glutamate ligase [Prochlorococcus sp. MIT 1307]
MESKIVIIGLGRSGIGAAKLLNSEGHQVIVFESREGPSYKAHAEKLKGQGIQVELGTPLKLSSFQPWLNQLSSVVISPAIPWNHPVLNELRSQGVHIKGEITLAWEHLKHLPWVGITGTNGKTTVTHMLNHVLEQNQLVAPMGGNVGNSAAEIALAYLKKKQKPDWLIMELSSYQLEASPEISPNIGIWTNLTPDHLERHGNLEVYSNIKRRLLENSVVPIYNADDRFLSKQKNSLKEGIWISAKDQNNTNNSAEFWINDKGMIIEKGKELFHSSVLNMPGIHNLQNLLIVTAAARQTGLSASNIKKSISTFTGVPHRLEKLGCLHGLNIFNDSKATNFESAKMGLIAVSPPTIILAGGQPKEGDPSEWLKAIHKRACGIVLFGSGATHLKNLIELSNFQGTISCCKELEKAVTIAIEIGKNKKAKSLILSPACASFDQYKDYEERGEHFQKLISSFLSI